MRSKVTWSDRVFIYLAQNCTPDEADDLLRVCRRWERSLESCIDDSDLWEDQPPEIPFAVRSFVFGGHVALLVVDAASARIKVLRCHPNPPSDPLFDL